MQSTLLKQNPPAVPGKDKAIILDHQSAGGGEACANGKQHAALGVNHYSAVIPRRQPLAARVGLIGVGHEPYWPQFDGLLAEMSRKQKVVADRLASHGVTVTDFGLVDNAATAYAAVPEIKAADLDMLFIDMVTYATSSTFGTIARELKGLPIVLVALQPLKAMDYPNGSTYMQLCNDDFCAVPEFTGVAVRMGRRAPPVILGHEEDDPQSEAELARWCGIAKVLHDLRRGRLGLMGHPLEAMLDMHCDPTAITAAFGCHVPLLEPHDMLRHFELVDEASVEAKKRNFWIFSTLPNRSPIRSRRSSPKSISTAPRVVPSRLMA